MLTEKERLDYCKACKNRKLDLSTGMLCGITDKAPDFVVTCENYSEVSKYVVSIENGINNKDVNWDKLDAVKEINFKGYSQSDEDNNRYVEKLIESIGAEDIRWWNCEKSNQINIAKSIKVAYEPLERNFHFVWWGVSGFVFLIFFGFTKSFLFSFLILSAFIGILMYFLKRTPKYISLELNREHGIVKIPNRKEHAKYVLHFSKAIFIITSYPNK